MKKFKINKIALFMVVILTLTACEDYLERPPLARYDQDTYPVGAGLSTYIFGMYSQLREFHVHTMGFVAVSNIRSEDADKGSTPADGATIREMDDFTVLPSNGYVNNFWINYYEAIGQANLVLVKAEELRDEVTEEEYMNARGEALFIRGYLYFNLVRTYGGVPIVTSVVSSDDNFSIPRASEQEVYDQIIEDLNEAINLLPETWDEFFIGRVARSAAQGILAKVYLYQERYADALAMAENVIGSGLYDLSTPYDVIFTEEGENSSGSIFEVQALRNENYQTNAFGSQYGQVQGVRGSGQWNLGWGFNVPSEQLVAAYETGDPRMDATILFGGETTPYGEVVPSDLPNPRYNQKVYTDPDFREAANTQGGWWVNIRILRYADVILIAAEAANELGQTEQALEYLEMVRARARAGNNNILPEITTTDQEELRQAIRQERRIELAMEHERFFDLVRYDIAEEVLHAAGKTNFVAGKHELLPIPQQQIDLSGGVLTQNEGY